MIRAFLGLPIVLEGLFRWKENRWGSWEGSISQHELSTVLSLLALPPWSSSCQCLRTDIKQTYRFIDTVGARLYRGALDCISLAFRGIPSEMSTFVDKSLLYVFVFIPILTGTL